MTRLLLLALMTVASSSASANPTHDNMNKLSESDRNEYFSQFMGKTPESCKVERSFFQGFTEEQAAVWSIACTNKKSYAIMLENDPQGGYMFVECEQLKAGTMGARECFKKY